jgi:hypothetical protein
MEQMMARQGVGMTPGGGHVVRICMTLQDVDMDQPRPGRLHAKVDRVGANTVKVAFQCKGGKGQPPSSGEGTVTIESSHGLQRQAPLQDHAGKRPPRADRHGAEGPLAGADCGQVALQSAPALK